VSSTNHSSLWVCQHNRHTVGHSNSQRNSGQIGDHRVGTGKLRLSLNVIPKIPLGNPSLDVVWADPPHFVAMYLMANHHRTQAKPRTKRVNMLEDSGVFISATEVKSFKTSTPASLPGSVDTISEGDPDAMIGTGVDNESQHVTSGSQGYQGRHPAPQAD
jgi:hypothetical protein